MCTQPEETLPLQDKGRYFGVQEAWTGLAQQGEGLTPWHGCSHGHPAALEGSCKLARPVRLKQASSEGLFASLHVRG